MILGGDHLSHPEMNTFKPKLMLARNTGTKMLLNDSRKLSCFVELLTKVPLNARSTPKQIAAIRSGIKTKALAMKEMPFARLWFLGVQAEAATVKRRARRWDTHVRISMRSSA